MFIANLPFNAGVFDIVWVIALLFGLWSGQRAGLTGEVVRFITSIAMVWVSLAYYVPAGDWIRSEARTELEVSRFIAFVGLMFVSYVAAVIIRKLLSQWTKKSPSAAFFENAGGAILGFIRMLIVMSLLTLTLCLIRSPVIHDFVARKSIFSSAVVKLVPSVEAVTKKKWPETFPLFKDIDRPFDADIEDYGLAPTNQPKKKTP